MESSIPNSSSSSAKSITLNDKMESSNEDFDQQVLRDAGEQTISAEWSATVSAFNSSDLTSSNSFINIETLKECCDNSSDTLKNKEDYMVCESSSTVINISKFNANDTKYYSERKTTAFQKKHKPLSQNFSRCFENILDDDSQMEITQNSICLNRFQKRKRLIPPNDEEFIEINNSNYSSGLDSVDVSMMKSPKLCFTRKKKSQFDIPDYNLSATDNESIADDTNISKRKENKSNLPFVVNISSNTIKNVSKTEVFPHKFSLKTIGIADSVFENIINNSSMVSDITLNNKNASLNETSLSNVNNSVFSKMGMSNLNYTYDVSINDNTILDDIVENDKSMSETHVLHEYNKSKSLNLRPLKFNFNNKFGRHSLSYQENCSNFDVVKKQNISLNTVYAGEEYNIFDKAANDGNVNLESNQHISKIQETDNSSKQIQPLDDLLLTNTLNQEQLKSKRSISSNSNNEDLLLPNTSTGSLKSNDFQKNQSKHSISSTSSNDGLTLLNSTTGLLESCSSSRLLTTKHSRSSTSNNDTLNLFIESLDNNESHENQSKHSISSTSSNEGLSLTNSATEFSGRRSSSRNKSTSSKHSTSVTGNNDNLTLNATIETLTSGRSLRNQSKHSTSVISNIDSLSLLNTTIESLKSNESQRTQSKRSISPTSYNEGLTLTNSATEFSGRRSSSRNKSTSSKQSTSVTENNDNLTLNATTEALTSGRSLRNQSKHSTSVTKKNDNLTLNATTETLTSGRSLRNQSKHSTSVISNNDSLTLLNTTMESLKCNESQKAQLKHSISSNNSTIVKALISGNEDIPKKQNTDFIKPSNLSILENDSSNNIIDVSKTEVFPQKFSRKSIGIADSAFDNIINNSSITSDIALNNKKTSLNETSSSVSNVNNIPVISKMVTSNLNHTYDIHTNLNTSTTNVSIDGDANTPKVNENTDFIKPSNFSILANDSSNNTLDVSKTEVFPQKFSRKSSLEQKVLSINQSNSSLNISIKTSINGLKPEDDINYVNITQPFSSIQKSKSYDNIEQIMPNITDGSLVENQPSKTRVLRSSLRISKNKSKNNVNNVSGSTKTSKNIVNFNNESFDNNSDNSLFWTTLPDESTNMSNIQNVNNFQTPKINKLTIAENIVNTIKIMSTNQKSTHPGAFELEDHENGPLTRSYVTRTYNRSPSILTLVFGGQNSSESTSSLTNSLTEINIDQSQVEENVKQKFKSLYKKEFWITKRLYKFLIIKLQPNYNIYSVKYAEKFVKYLAQLLKKISSDQVNLQLCTDMLRYHMARYQIIKDTFDYLGFLTDYIPMAYFKKLVPGWNLETSAVKFDPQKYYIPLMEDEEFLNYIMEQLNES